MPHKAQVINIIIYKRRSHDSKTLEVLVRSPLLAACAAGSAAGARCLVVKVQIGRDSNVGCSTGPFQVSCGAKLSPLYS